MYLLYIKQADTPVNTKLIMGSCTSYQKTTFNASMKTKQKFINSKQDQLNILSAEITTKQRTIEFIKNENTFLREQISEARSDLWNSEKERLKSHNHQQMTLRNQDKAINKIEKIIFEKEQINALMRIEYDELSNLHDSMMKRKRKKRRQQTLNIESSYNTFSDH